MSEFDLPESANEISESSSKIGVADSTSEMFDEEELKRCDTRMSKWENELKEARRDNC